MVGFIPFLGLKIIKPQEALVLTLFGKYIGTLNEPGFYFVNPFAVAVKPDQGAPGAERRRGQRRQTSRSPSRRAAKFLWTADTPRRFRSKSMTLNNAKQKVNDVLGNPVEIGVAVVWRVVDTAKAVFNVDNYKEYLSLQCDSAVRDIVRIYPYDGGPRH